ncbi:MAG: VOC family protein [Nocardioides sp.]|nr:VOC family protein [Nocardioides sp.]
MGETYPSLLQTVIDAVDVRAEAEFYRRLLGLRYRPGDEPPTYGADDADWLVLADEDGRRRLAFQQVEPGDFEPTTWPERGVGKHYHLDTGVPDVAELDRQHERALALGARLRSDQSDDPDEQLRVYRDPEGHLFCIFVGS